MRRFLRLREVVAPPPPTTTTFPSSRGPRLLLLSRGRPGVTSDDQRSSPMTWPPNQGWKNKRTCQLPKARSMFTSVCTFAQDASYPMHACDLKVKAGKKLLSCTHLLYGPRPTAAKVALLKRCPCGAPYRVPRPAVLKGSPLWLPPYPKATPYHLRW